MSIETSYPLGILGAGNMASAVVAGLLESGAMGAGDIIASSPTDARRAAFAERFGVATTADNAVVAAGCRTLLVAVKPQKAAAVLAGVAAVLPVDALVVSVMAGAPAAAIDRLLGGGRRVVRAMPNTPLAIGRGVTAVAPGPRATAADLATARSLFAPAGIVIDIDESQLDAVIAVGGSGPAYFFFLVEHMTATGVALGLSPGQAKLLATQTCVGAAAMLAETGAHPADLRQGVTSPGGTTAAAIAVMEARGVPAAVADAMAAAVARSRELAKTFG